MIDGQLITKQIINIQGYINCTYILERDIFIFIKIIYVFQYLFDQYSDQSQQGKRNR